MTEVQQTFVGAEMARSRRRRRSVIATVVVVVLACAAFGAWLWLSAEGGAVSFGFDESAKAGQAPYKTDEEIQAELNRVVEEGMFDISIASVIEFDTPSALGTAYIENVPGNRYDMRVSIALDSTGDEVYRSGGLAPGTYVESIALEEALEPGTYEATATFEALDRETHETVGTAGAKVTLVVKEG